ncbi:hypothetical protein IWQ62_005435 [Dispira parvispora]|uniref:Peptidase A1 domain-containing protein n=1 Tax=Dispira parvispora TaxID=1520584 RepID=A0A9W8AM84_9FUNG|nr:hypothetical protein IWQ62_005435 [Dispira parvispora]
MVHVLRLVALAATMVTAITAQEYKWKVETIDLRSLSEGNYGNDRKPPSRLRKVLSTLSLRDSKVSTNAAPSSGLPWESIHGLTVSPASYDVPFVEMTIPPSGQSFRMLVDTSLDGIFLLSSKLKGLPAYYHKVDESLLTKIQSDDSADSNRYNSLFDMTQYHGNVIIGHDTELQTTINVVTKFTSDKVRPGRFPIDGIIGLGGSTSGNLADTLLGKICGEDIASFTININGEYDAGNSIELCSPLSESNPPQKALTTQADFSPRGEWITQEVVLYGNDEIDAVARPRLLVNPAFAEILPTETMFPGSLHSDNVELPRKTHYPSIIPSTQFRLRFSLVKQGILPLTENELVFREGNDTDDYLALRPFEDYDDTYHLGPAHGFGNEFMGLGRPLFKRYKVYFKYHEGDMIISFVDRKE